MGSMGAAALGEARERVAVASRALSDAIVANDADGIAEWLGDEWRLIDEDGETTRARFLEVVRSGELTHSEMRPIGDVEVRVYGDTAIVFARVVNTAHVGSRTFHADEWTTDVFVLADGRWRCVHSHATSVRT